MNSKFTPINQNNLVMVAGGTGMVGKSIVKKLKSKNYKKILSPSSDELDLRNQTDVNNYLKEHKPDYIFICAGKVGGIKANDTLKAEFLYDNLMIQSNLINGAYINKINNLMYFASSCIYPKFSKQPIKEKCLLTGELEKTNEGYALAKIAGIKMCETYNFQYGCNYMSVLPTNLYGPNDNYDLENSHVLPALLHKSHLAKVHAKKFIEVWGSGEARREFLHVDDLADACIFLSQTEHNHSMINIGTGKDISIKELAIKINEITGYSGGIKFNTTIKDGTPRKLLDNSIINKLGWKYNIDLSNGIAHTYIDFKNTYIDKS